MITEETPKAFKFVDFAIPKFSLDFQNQESEDLKMSFKPSGVYNETTGNYDVHLLFEAIDVNSKSNFITAHCVFQFEFDSPYKFEEIPPYFFTNSIPIAFPYLRAFISNLSVQANIDTIILDLIKFSGVAKPLQENTEIVK